MRIIREEHSRNLGGILIIGVYQNCIICCLLKLLKNLQPYGNVCAFMGIRRQYCIQIRETLCLA